MKQKRHGLFYSKREETVNSISHGIGIAMGVIAGFIFLTKCYQSRDSWAVFGMWLYLFGMGGSYLSSTLYHSIKHHSLWKRRLRHWDHAAIYWHIAGSFSPVTLIALRGEGAWGWGLFGFVWLCAIIGTLVSFRKMEEHSHLETICFIVMGLSILAVSKCCLPLPRLPAIGLLQRESATSPERRSTRSAISATPTPYFISSYWKVRRAIWWQYGTYWKCHRYIKIR